MTRKHYAFKHKIVSVDRFPDLQNDINVLLETNKLSNHPRYRSYIDPKRFILPENFLNAKSVIVIAKETPLALADFQYKGKIHTFMIPPQYHDDGTKIEDVEQYIYDSIIQESKSKTKYKIARAKNLFLKLLAVRSGLSKYGRNNISYVEEFGSFYWLYAFFTDFIPETYDWSERQVMKFCETCKICQNMCPTSAIREDEFVIDAGKCVTLYNEVNGEFPEEFSPNVHNALIGCMKCQYACPGNKIVIKNPIHQGIITEEEILMVLEGRKEENLIRSLTSKLKMFTYEDYDSFIPVFRRNLAILLN
jgi:epoxyqueuosine reductase